MLRLEPMTEAEFSEFVERAVPRRAARMVARGVWAEPRSIEASRAAYRRAFPQGRATPDEHVCHLVRTADGARVGEVWYSTRSEGGLLQFWIEWIWVEPQFRRQGLASAALTLLEEEARQLGAARLGLDVWMDNPGAVELYRRLGYGISRASMVKRIQDPPRPP
jgi:ribosomal protein S18 acetylase RimI-like enzyme